MSAVWPTKKLREIAEIRVSNVDKKTHFSENPVKLCNYMDVYSNDYVTGKIDFMEASATQAEIERFGLKFGDVIITKDSETPDDIGIPTVITEEITGLVCGYHLALIRPDSEELDSIYLAKQLSTSQVTRYFSLHASGSTRYGLPVGAIESLEIPTPPKPEQTKIAEILSTVDRAIEQTEALIAKQQRIKTGLMQDLLTRGIDEHGNLRSEQTHQFKDSPLGRIPVEWEVKPIETKLECIIDYRGRTPVKTDSGIPLITAKNVREGFLCEEPREFIATDAYDSWMTRGIPEPGDVMITTEAPMGNVARVPDYKIALAQRLITLPTKKNELSSDFLFWTLHWSRTLERLELLTSGSTVVGIKQSAFRKVEFSFPPLDEQSKIAALLNAERGAAETNLKHLSKLRALKTALMQDLLTGRKRVTALLDGKETSA
jgi:type I restriction enzyme S subunit